MSSVGQAARHMEGVQQMEGGFLTSVLNLIKKRDKCLLCDAISLNVQDLPGDEIIFSFFTPDDKIIFSFFTTPSKTIDHTFPPWWDGEGRRLYCVSWTCLVAPVWLAGWIKKYYIMQVTKLLHFSCRALRAVQEWQVYPCPSLVEHLLKDDSRTL